MKNVSQQASFVYVLSNHRYQYSVEENYFTFLFSYHNSGKQEARIILNFKPPSISQYFRRVFFFFVSFLMKTEVLRITLIVSTEVLSTYH